MVTYPLAVIMFATIIQTVRCSMVLRLLLRQHVDCDPDIADFLHFVQVVVLCVDVVGDQLFEVVVGVVFSQAPWEPFLGVLCPITGGADHEFYCTIPSHCHLPIPVHRTALSLERRPWGLWHPL